MKLFLRIKKLSVYTIYGIGKLSRFCSNFGEKWSWIFYYQALAADIDISLLQLCTNKDILMIAITINVGKPQRRFPKMWVKLNFPIHTIYKQIIRANFRSLQLFHYRMQIIRTTTLFQSTTAKCIVLLLPSSIKQNIQEHTLCVDLLCTHWTLGMPHRVLYSVHCTKQVPCILWQYT